MRSVAFSILACWFCVASVAHASTGSAAPSVRNDAASTRHVRKEEPSLSRNSPTHKPPRSSATTLTLEPAVPLEQEVSPAIKSVQSLANGAAPVNPWFPERGAIGVRMKVTW